MRTLSAGALSQIAERFGNEPINILEVAWTLNGTPVRYADRDIGKIRGRILELTTLDSVVNVARNGQSQEIHVKLDDTDGSLKPILDNNDIHQRSVWVYQYFHGMSLSDKFLLFKGQISSPVTYSEGERTLSFTVISQIEDTEIGFSADEGRFDFVADHLIGKPWPLNFGTVIHGKTLRLTEVIKGIVAKSVGVSDFALPYRRAALALVAGFYSQQASNYSFAAQKHVQFSQFYSDRASSLDPETESARISSLQQLAQGESDIAASHQQNADRFAEQATDFALGASSVLTAYNQQVATEPTSFRVIGGKDFPRGPLSLKIGDAIFNGAFVDDTDEFGVQQIIHPKVNELAVSNTPLEVPQLPGVRIQSVSQGDTRLETSEPDLPLMFLLFDAFPPTILSQYSIQMFGEHAGYLYLDAGSVVEIASEEGQEYIASIVPGEVLKVSAFLNKNGVQKLVTVPEEYYTVIQRNYGGLTAVIVRLEDALSKIEDGEWGEEIFVTFESSVGPNTVDVLEYLIDTYTDFSVNTSSFNSVRTALTNYPSHFQITDRKQVLTALSEIAWQARCAIWLSNDVFFLRYLPAVPASVTTITDSDVDVATLEVGFTPTEDIVTKLICRWRATGAQTDDNIVLLRHNIKKYGTKERTFDFYIYNAADFVIKSATFWMIRYSNTWKKAKFQTPLNQLHVESLDGIELDFNKPWLASSAVVGIVEQANYDSESRKLNFEVWTPVRAGEMSAYDFAHPAAIDTTLKFPTDEEEELDFDGGVGPGKLVGDGFSIGVPIGNFSASYVNPDFYDLLKRRFNDRGQRRPSDLNDQAPGDPVIENTPALTNVSSGPLSPLPNNVVPTVQIVKPTVSSAGTGVTEITFETPIIDNTDPENPITTSLGEILEYDETLELHAARLAKVFNDEEVD